MTLNLIHLKKRGWVLSQTDIQKNQHNAVLNFKKSDGNYLMKLKKKFSKNFE